MRVLLIGAAGNLGSRVIPALLSHGHTVVALVRSPDKLKEILTPALLNHTGLTAITGDALSSHSIEAALRSRDCDAIVQTAGVGRTPVLGAMATAISDAAIAVSRDRGVQQRPLRCWFIGGLGSLEYPGTGGFMIQDYMPNGMTAHHRQTEEVLKGLSTSDVRWTLLCVALMTPESKTEKVDVWHEPRKGRLVVRTGGKPADWEDSWIRWIPFLGPYLNLIPAVLNNKTKLEDVADLIARHLDDDSFVGQLVGFKESAKEKLN